MFDSLWDQSPIIRQMRAASKEEGKEEGKVEEKVEALQKTVVNIVKARFPLLADLAQQKATLLNDIEKLDNLIIQISTAPDETSIRLLLAPTVA
jgi:predicted transposase YdaD